MAHKEKPPGAGDARAASEFRSWQNVPEDTALALIIQASRLERRFALTKPTALVVARLAYQTKARP